MAPKPKMYNACAVGGQAAAKAMHALVLETLENDGVVIEAAVQPERKEVKKPEVIKPVATAKPKAVPVVVVPEPVEEEVTYENPEPVQQETPPEPVEAKETVPEVVVEAAPTAVEEAVPEPEPVGWEESPSQEDLDGDEAMRMLEEQIHSME